MAFWNLGEGSSLEYDGDFPLMKERDSHTDSNRSEGIDIGCYDNQIDELKYPLKLVSIEFNGTYEDCKGRSYGDPNQGFGEVTREDYDNGDIYGSDDFEEDDYY